MTETKKAKRGVAAKVLMPVVATVASAAASYLAKKGPQYIEQTLMPKLRETKDSAGGVAERAKSVVGADGEGDGGDSRSMDELAERRRERADHRAARRKAS